MGLDSTPAVFPDGALGIAGSLRSFPDPARLSVHSQEEPFRR